MPPDVFFKVEVVVKEEEEGLDLDDWFCAGSHGRGRAVLPRDRAGRHRWERGLTVRRRRPSHRHLPLRRSRDAQRRLLGGGEVAQAH
eukprot:scaffold130644_cov57-Phaeocystis_antarctica.AAC.2